MTISERIRVSIIGCGRIGTEWDRGTSTNSFPLTHARVFSQHPRTHLVALCDSDESKATSAAQFWRVPKVYKNPRQLFAEQEVDIAVIALPSSVRWEAIEPALGAGVKVVVIEKPLATTLEECHRIVSAINLSDAHALVNYSRNWDPSMRVLKDRIAAGDMGKIQRLFATYGKGISNNGSHLINLVGFLLGASPVRARALGTPLDAQESSWSSTNDVTFDAQVEFIDSTNTHVSLTLLGTDHRAFTCLELRIIGERAIFEMEMGGRRLNWSNVQSDPNFEGYVVPAPPVILESHYLQAMQGLANEAIRLAAGEITTASCDVNTALSTALVIEAIKLSAYPMKQERLG
jgi:predicted dehydrogenase